ncbi:NAD(+) diphosphatase [Thalassolituus sp. LLYu03]|uniref:NAD(+) diphosphatase n=1 Tax=Thalassolituus sp. LLYu03 TaxID=3421656 RepID=UPI003D2DB83A
MTLEFTYHPAIIAGEDSPQTFSLYFLGERLILPKGVMADALHQLPWTQDSVSAKPVLELVLGDVNGQALRVVELAEIPEGYEEVSLRDYLLASNEDTFRVVNAAAQLRYWRSTQNFCSRCGTGLTPIANDRALVCPSCSYRSYPKISPCVIAVVRKGRQLLLANSNRHRTAMYSCLAGFIEAGETAEEALVREVFEEAGIQVKNPQYLVSQAWPFPHQLMLGYLCEYDSGELNIDTTELNSADWFDIDDLPLLPAPQTVARKLIEAAADRVRTGV